MKKFFCFLVILTILVSCKKEDKETPGSSANTNTTANLPPVAGDYWVLRHYKSGHYRACWTEDLKNFNVLTTAYDDVAITFGSGDTLLIVQESNNKYLINYGNINNLPGFKTISCNWFPSQAAYINGVITVSSYDNGIAYIGYCDTKAGQNEVTFSLLSGSFFGRFYHVGQTVIANAFNSGFGPYHMAYTKDGKDWIYTSPPANDSSQYTYLNIDNVTYACGLYTLYNTTNTEYNSASWLSKTPPAVSDSSIFLSASEYFYGAGVFYRSDKWRKYAMLIPDSTQNCIPAVFTSLDNGQNWSHSLLTGIPTFNSVDNPSILDIYATKTKTLMCIGSLTLPPVWYTSTDGINFTHYTFSSSQEKTTIETEMFSAVYFP